MCPDHCRAARINFWRHKAKFPQTNILECFKLLPEGLYSLQKLVISPSPSRSHCPHPPLWCHLCATSLQHHGQLSSNPHLCLWQFWTGGVFSGPCLFGGRPPPHPQTQQGQKMTFIFETPKDVLSHWGKTGHKQSREKTKDKRVRIYFIYLFLIFILASHGLSVISPHSVFLKVLSLCRRWVRGPFISHI